MHIEVQMNTLLSTDSGNTAVVSKQDGLQHSDTRHGHDNTLHDVHRWLRDGGQDTAISSGGEGGLCPQLQ